MAQPLQFSPVHGENIALDKHSVRAKWAPERSGGWMFASSPLEAGREILVTLDGSGHCDVGVIKTDPKDCDILAKPSMFKKLNNIQFHKMNCRIPVRLNTDGSEVKSVYNGQVYKKPVDKKGFVWIAVYVKFGDVTTRLLDETTGKLHKFSENHGTNVRLDDYRRQAVTVNPNPAALCFVGTTLLPRETIQLACDPLQDGNRKPSRFHLKLLICAKKPESYLSDFKSAFDTSLVPVSDPPFTVIEILEKGECDGSVSITLDESLHIKYVSATNKQNNQNLNFNPASGVWVGLELFRVSVKLKSCIRQQPELGRQGLDVVDARVREPQNENQEDSLAPFDSFVNRLQKSHREEPYISNEGQDLRAVQMTPQEHNSIRTHSLEKRSPAGQRDKLQKNSRNPPEQLYINRTPKDAQPVEDAGYVQRVQDKKVVFNLHPDTSRASSCSKQTVPKVLQIPKLMQIPIPNRCNDSIYQSSGSSTRDPRENIIVPTTQSPLPYVESINTMGTCNESVIVSRLSRIERTLLNIAEKVSINHNGATIDKQHRPSSNPDLTNTLDANNDPIQKNWVSLVENICADKLCDHLYQGGFIRDDERQSITDLYKSEAQAANRRLLHLIQRRKVPTQALIKIFDDAQQGHLVGSLKQ